MTTKTTNPAMNDEAKLQTVLAGLKEQFKSDQEPVKDKVHYDLELERMVEQHQRRKALSLYIGQAHLLPGMSCDKLKKILAEMGVDDWNRCSLSVLETTANRVKGPT
jgi:hypothetical protein